MEVDYIIVGQGICGTMLSYYLLQAGKKIAVIDKWQPHTASRVASGIINPVTGRRVVKTWMIDDLLPFAEGAYDTIGELIGADIAKQINILSFHNTEQMSSAWHERVTDGEEYISNAVDLDYYNSFFNINNGAGMVLSSMMVDLDTLLTKWRAYLKDKNCLYEDVFVVNENIVTDEYVHYNDIKSEKLIFCDGINSYNNPFFEKLPFTLTKGEVLIVQIPDLPQKNIYKHGISLVPLGHEMFWIGSSFQWDFENDQPTESFRLKTEKHLKDWLKLPYKVLDHIASVRPGSVERRPFVGMHPRYKNVGILNGMGTKGCSLAPFFAQQLCQQLLKGQPVLPEANISRFKKLLIGN